MILIAAIAAYAASMVAANAAVAHWGPWVSPINAFVLIGLDLAIRDWLHVRLWPRQMLALIISAGGLSYLLNPGAPEIAVASSVAFVAAGIADWCVFTAARGSWMRRVHASNVAGAAVDSLIFPTIAFGALMPGVVAAQFAAKLAGGAAWAWVIWRLSARRADCRMAAKGD